MKREHRHARVVWTRAPSHTWTTDALRDVVDTWALAFAIEHGWVSLIEIREGYAVAPNDLDTHPEHPAQQRMGSPILNIRVTRARDAQVFEVSVPFAGGPETANVESTLLFAARESLRELEKLAR